MSEENRAHSDAARRLDTLDQELWTLQAELDTHPKELALEREAVAEFARRAETAREALREREEAVARGEKDLALLQRRRTRAEDRLPYLTTASQVEAAQREIESLRGQAEAQEEAVLLAMEEVEERQAALAEAEARHRALLGALGDREAEWEGQRPGIVARVAELDTARGALEPALGPEALRIYRMGVHASAGRSRIPRGVTTVDHDLCTACGRHVPPRWQQEGRAHAAFYGCQGCKRLLLFGEAAAAPAQE